MGPMVLIQDKSTAMSLSVVERWLPPEPALCASACISGAVGALAVGCQIEGLITRAHGTGQTVTQTLWATRAAGGWLSVLVPYGALAIAAREVPYAGCMFFLSGWIRSKVHGRNVIGHDEGAAAAAAADAALPASSDGGARRIGLDFLTAALTAAVAGPISHAPSVIAAHQSAHAVDFWTACAHLRKVGGGGLSGFFQGLAPRTASLTGSLFVMPLAIECLQPLVEKYRHHWRRDA